MRLESSAASATFSLVSGGRLGSLIVDGLELLVTADDRPFGWGSFVMVPYAGRVAFGSFDFDGRTVELPISMAPHAIHGTAWMEPWRRTGPDTIGCSLGRPWPFGGTVSQSAELTDDHLRLTLSVTAGEQPMPAMVGWHPWFRRTLGDGSRATLAFEADAMYELDDDAIPTGRLVEPTEGPWDNCFTAMGVAPSITWGDRLRLDVSSSCDHWVIFDQKPHALCVEPQSSAPDVFNRDAPVLQPGETLQADVTMRWSRPSSPG